MTQRRILTPQDLEAFLSHPVCADYLRFIDRLNSSVVGLRRSECQLECLSSDGPVSGLIELVQRCRSAISLFNADKQYSSTDSSSNYSASRFGRVQFRDYYDYIAQNCSGWIKELVLTKSSRGDWLPADYLMELASYFGSCFGSRERIDYGTGHETHFLIFLHCLDRLCLFSSSTECAVYSQLVLRVFWEYVEWIRELLVAYWLEPAGSHGVWGLDDYHFVPFLFGSAQLVVTSTTNSRSLAIRPKSIHNSELVQEYSNDYLYFSCVHFVNSVKTESIGWHSPMLNDISGVKTWLKINQGMRKMYVGEVLSKLPIMQHLLMGRLFGNVGLSRMSAEELQEFHALLGNNNDCVEYIPASGHELPSQIISHLHAPDCASVSKQQQPIDGEFVETVVKYVTGPSGVRIPIKGRVPASALKNYNDTSSDSGGKESIVDTFALGQIPPSCCGIKIPSAIAAAQHRNNSGRQQELRKLMMPFD